MDLTAFFSMVSALDGNRDIGAMVPASDAEDFRNGARYIPGDVTMARRQGQKVHFDSVAHQWTMPDGRKIGGAA